MWTEDEVENGKGGAENLPETPSPVTSSWVSPYLKRVLPLDFQSRVPGFFRSMWVPFSGTCKSRILPCKSTISPPERNTVDILGLNSPVCFNESTYTTFPLFSYFYKIENIYSSAIF